MFYVITYTILAIGLAFLVGSGRFIWKLRAEDEVTITVHVPYEDDEDEDDYDDEDDEDDDDYDEDEDGANLVQYGPVYGPETFEIANMTLRLSKPHLFDDDWYYVASRDFSAWAVEEWVKIDAHQREMQIGRYRKDMTVAA